MIEYAEIAGFRLGGHCRNHENVEYCHFLNYGNDPWLERLTT